MNIPDAPVVELQIDGQKRKFDLDDPRLPDWVEENAFASGDYPYSDRLAGKKYDKTLEELQEELVKLMFWVQEKQQRIIVVFEGRDSAGKGGTIERFRENLNSRVVRTVALSKPSDREQGQWYFQRYVEQFPTTGEIVLFDRSWYNRAGVEPVMPSGRLWPVYAARQTSCQPSVLSVPETLTSPFSIWISPSSASSKWAAIFFALASTLSSALAIALIPTAPEREP